jgi:uncharacterized protein YoxC
MEVFKFILVNYGPVVAAVCLMVYLCFFVKKNINGNEQKLKNDIATLIRENAELKVQLKKSQELLNKGVEKVNQKVNELEEQLDGLIKESETNESNNETIKE